MTEINQKEYLKRYLNIGNDDGSKKKKRKKKPKNVLGTGLKIVDDDLGISHVGTVEEAVSLLETNEDAPQVAGYIDERPFEARLKDYRNPELWKPIGQEEQDDEVKDNSPLRHINESKDGKSNGSDSDASPPRRNRPLDNRKRKGSYTSPPGTSQSRTKQYDSDNSPPRKDSRGRLSKKRDFDQSPVRKMKRNLSDSDNSPPRSASRKKERSPDLSKRRNTDLDNSPPRNKTLNSVSDNSPPRQRNRVRSPDVKTKRRESDSDNSPPRNKHQNRNRSKSPGVQRNRRRNSVSDSCPPRRSNRNVSPDGRNKNRKSRWGSSDHQQPAKRNHRSPDSDNKPETSRKRSDSDNSPPRRNSEKSGGASKMAKTLDGKKAGLQNAKDLERETALFRKREDEHFRSLPAEVSGANAAPVMRDRRTGKIRDLKKEQEEKAEKDKREAAHKEKYSRWGKGIKQMEDKEQKVAQEAYEMTKPLARYADDQDLEKYLRDQEREGDPMLAYIRSKKKKQTVDSGKPSKPQYDGEYMPNRYGIPPGHRWDGVDRSNGYEKRWFEKQNSRKALEEESYKWSIEDM